MEATNQKTSEVRGYTMGKQCNGSDKPKNVWSEGVHYGKTVWWKRQTKKRLKWGGTLWENSVMEATKDWRLLRNTLICVSASWRRAPGSVTRTTRTPPALMPSCGLSDEDLGLRIAGWGLRVEGWGLRVEGWGLRVEGWGLRVAGWGLMISVLGFRVWGSGFSVKGKGFWVYNSGFRV
jgi:hypothetical protein